MKNLKTLAILMAICAQLFVACTKEETAKITNNIINGEVPIPTNLVKIGETYILGAQAKAVIYSNKAFFVGYNTIYVAMYDSATNARLTDGHFNFATVMEMGSMKHGSPVEVNHDVDSLTQLWKGAAVFTMAGTWHLEMSFHNHKVDLEGDGSLEVNAVNTTNAMVKVFTAAADSAKMVVTLINPSNPKMGLNNFEITIHKMADMMNFTAIQDYSVEIDPIMPSMGHGSPNNVNPTHIGNGHYTGIVNFTMSGLWRVAVTLKKDNVVMDNTQSFDISF
jgi:hypothetical protein